MMAYQWEAVRRGGETTEMAGCRRNPQGWADGLRRTALLVVAILLLISMSSSSRLVRLVPTPSATVWVFRGVL